MANSLLELLNPEDEGGKVFRNEGNYLPVDTESHPRKL